MKSAKMEVMKTPTMTMRLNLMKRTLRQKTTVMTAVITVKTMTKIWKKLLMTIMTMRLTKGPDGGDC